MRHIQQSVAIALALGSIGNAVAAVTAEEAKQGYLEFVKTKQVNTQDAVAELEKEDKNEPPGELAKRLRARPNISR